MTWIVTTMTEVTPYAEPVAHTTGRPMTADYEGRRPAPQGTVQAAHAVTEDVVRGLGGHPMMLGVVVLNVLAIAAAVYFLNLLIAGQQRHLGNLLELQTAHTDKILSVHNREFDALMEMLAQARGVTPSTPPPAVRTPR